MTNRWRIPRPGVWKQFSHHYVGFDRHQTCGRHVPLSNPIWHLAVTRLAGGVFLPGPGNSSQPFTWHLTVTRLAGGEYLPGPGNSSQPFTWHLTVTRLTGGEYLPGPGNSSQLNLAFDRHQAGRRRIFAGTWQQFASLYLAFDRHQAGRRPVRPLPT
jgi:hypothetical protein